MQTSSWLDDSAFSMLASSASLSYQLPQIPNISEKQASEPEHFLFCSTEFQDVKRLSAARPESDFFKYPSSKGNWLAPFQKCLESNNWEEFIKKGSILPKTLA